MFGALFESPEGGVIRVAFAPTGLGFLAERGPADGVVTGSLAGCNLRFGLEPAAADRAWSFLRPGLWLCDDDSSLSSLTGRPADDATSYFTSACLAHFWKAELGNFFQAPKECTVLAL